MARVCEAQLARTLYPWRESDFRRGPYGVVLAFIVDVVLKEWVRRLPDTAARFSLPTPFGTVGIVPSTNTVLAFSLPIPNAWIWPVGWIIVLVLAAAFLRNENSKLETQNSKQCSKFDFLKFEYLHLFRISDFGFRISSRRLAMSAMLLGAFSNLFDRTFLGGVTDYLALTDLFPAFNISDLLIIGGVIEWVRHSRQ